VTLRLFHDWVLVEIEPPDEKRGSIFVPDTAKTYYRAGVVLATGPGRSLPNGRTRPINVKAGDRVVFPVATQQLKQGVALAKAIEGSFEGKNVGFIRELDILAVVDPGVHIDN